MNKKENNVRKRKVEESPSNTLKVEVQKCSGENHSSPIDLADKIQIYQIGMDHEEHIRTAYQSLLTTLEVALFTIAITFLKLGWIYYVWILAVIGITLCYFFGIACEFRARNVDMWRIHIVKLAMKTDVRDAFKDSKYRWIPFGKVGFRAEYLFGHWFERLLLPFIFIVWIFVMWYFPTPLTFRLCSIVAFFIWIIIIYRFDIIEKSGKIVPYLHRQRR